MYKCYGNHLFYVVQAIEKKKKQTIVTQTHPLSKSTQVKSLKETMEGIHIGTKCISHDIQPKSPPTITSSFLLNEVSFHGRVVSFDEKCKLQMIPLSLQREVYKEAVFIFLSQLLAKYDWNGYNISNN